MSIDTDIEPMLVVEALLRVRSQCFAGVDTGTGSTLHQHLDQGTAAQLTKSVEAQARSRVLPAWDPDARGRSSDMNEG
jgi:hypothetical protein